jgi:outer membrane protein
MKATALGIGILLAATASALASSFVPDAAAPPTITTDSVTRGAGAGDAPPPDEAGSDPLAEPMRSETPPSTDPVQTDSSRAASVDPEPRETSIPSALLDSLRRTVLERNRDIAEARLLWLSAIHAARSTWGEYEPRAVYSRQRREQGRASEPFPEIRDTWSATIQGLLPTGTRYEAGYHESALRRSASNSEATASASLRQPLLRGLVYHAPWIARRAAIAERDRTFHKYRSVVMERLVALETALWEAYAAQERLASESRSVEVARGLLADGARRSRVGLISDLDLERLASELALRMARAIDARRASREARGALSLVVGDTSGVPFPLPEVLPDPGPALAGDTTLTYHLDSLAMRQPDLRSLEAERERLVAERDGHRGSMLPKLDLTFAAGYVGTGRDPQAMRAKFEDPSLRDQFTSLGVELEVPLFLDIKERELERASRLSVRAASMRSVRLERKLTQGVEEQFHRSKGFLETILEQQTVVDYQVRALNAEISKIRSGKSNYQLVYEIEEKLREAERSLIEARRNQATARGELARLSGRLLLDLELEVFQGKGEFTLTQPLLEP